MERAFPVNDMLRDEITKLNYTLIPPGYRGDVRSVRLVQDSLAKLIDQLGEQSAATQGLNNIMTTAEKLRNSPAHILYLLKDANAKGGKGEVIGMLKVGRKHLFLFDEREENREVDPLCVLDFYVQHDRQRHGYGRKLFDFMLRDMETSAHLLAVDGPSVKMEQFLIKNYGMERLVRQNNNFAVAPKFFDCNLDEISKSGASTPAVVTAVGRFSAPRPHSAIGNIIHGGGGHSQNTNGAFPEASPEEALAAGVEPEVVHEAESVAEPVGEPELAVAEEVRGLERPCTLQVETAASALPSPAVLSPAAPSPAGSTISRRDSQLTEKGFFDVKFYHNKLCECGTSAPTSWRVIKVADEPVTNDDKQKNNGVHHVLKNGRVNAVLLLIADDGLQLQEVLSALFGSKSNESATPEPLPDETPATTATQPLPEKTPTPPATSLLAAAASCFSKLAAPLPAAVASAFLTQAAPLSNAAVSAFHTPAAPLPAAAPSVLPTPAAPLPAAAPSALPTPAAPLHAAAPSALPTPAAPLSDAKSNTPRKKSYDIRGSNHHQLW